MANHTLKILRCVHTARFSRYVWLFFSIMIERLKFRVFLEKLLLPIQGHEYVFDVFAQLEREKIKFSLAFRKVLWYQTMRFGNKLFSQVIYNQVSRLF